MRLSARKLLEGFSRGNGGLWAANFDFYENGTFPMLPYPLKCFGYSFLLGCSKQPQMIILDDNSIPRLKRCVPPPPRCNARLSSAPHSVFRVPMTWGRIGLLFDNLLQAVSRCCNTAHPLNQFKPTRSSDSRVPDSPRISPTISPRSIEAPSFLKSWT